MLQYDFDESVGCWIALANQSLRRAVAARLADESITIRQWEVLAWVTLKGGEVSQGELADMLGIEAPTLVGVVSRMERDGWLLREGCSEDRRKKLIRPSEKAESLWSRMVECCHAVREQATQGFSREEMQQLKDFTLRIRANLCDSDDSSCADSSSG
jgi:MarR family transcriptional regulator for hemolysin